MLYSSVPSPSPYPPRQGARWCIEGQLLGGGARAPKGGCWAFNGKLIGNDGSPLSLPRHVEPRRQNVAGPDAFQAFVTASAPTRGEVVQWTWSKLVGKVVDISKKLCRAEIYTARFGKLAGRQKKSSSLLAPSAFRRIAGWALHETAKIAWQVVNTKYGKTTAAAAAASAATRYLLPSAEQ